MEIKTFESKDGASTEIAQELSSLLLDAKSIAKPVLLLVSGGSALGILDKLEYSVLGLDLTIGVLDERYSEDSEVNNFKQVMQTDFGQSAKDAKCKFIDTSVQDGESQESLVVRFESALAGWRVENPGGEIVITQGFGPDGHTSGIMPFPENELMAAELFNTPSKHVVGYDAQDKNPHKLRITTTFSFLREEVNTSFVFACGEDKQEALRHITADKGSLFATPGRIVHEMKDVVLYTDVKI